MPLTEDNANAANGARRACYKNAHANKKNYEGKNLVHPELSYLVYGPCFKVHNKLGRFLSEKSYADALGEIFKENNVGYIREKSLKPSFTGEGRRNIPDFIVEGKIILDVKAKRIISKEDYFQMRRYLSACGLKLGIIVNFRQIYLTPKRVVCEIKESADNP